MAIPSKQIGWSTQSNLLWQISKELDRLICVTAGGCGTTTTTSTSSSTTTTTTTSPSVGCDCRPGQFTESGVWNYFDCTGFNEICTSEACRVPVQPCFNINQPYSGIEINTEAGWTCECSTTTTTTTSPA